MGGSALFPDHNRHQRPFYMHTFSKELLLCVEMGDMSALPYIPTDEDGSSHLTSLYGPWRCTCTPIYTIPTFQSGDLVF